MIVLMSFSEDRLASKAGFTSSGTFMTVSGVREKLGAGGGWEEEEGEGEKRAVESGSGQLPPEITVNKSGELGDECG